jgi:hypothetical protein
MAKYLLILLLAVIALSSFTQARLTCKSGLKLEVRRLEPIKSNIYIPSEAIHTAAATLAQLLLTTNTSKSLSQLLPLVNGNLAKISNWAQAVRDNPLYEFAEPLHLAYTPQWNCSFIRSRDCASNICVDGAVQNYTQRTVDSSLDADQRTEAIMFLVHFIIDANQPLHVGFKSDIDGFKLTGKFLDKHYDLHTIWDDTLIQTRIMADFNNDINQWINSLVDKLCSVDPVTVEAWQSCGDSNDQYNSCSELWASEANQAACSTAYLFNGAKISSGFDLDKTYYTSNIEGLETILLKSAVRLANVLNTMFSGNN